ncbi:beclin-1-like [Oncorhynchus tshawytscha]|uniref:beclin-1-like n=1 Tax=Oncorhynchus tshawytscha TaxID=74940 RepID=UPI000D0A33A0|nr:beclin-1-like [Oncorhynchus tshawytscha]
MCGSHREAWMNRCDGCYQQVRSQTKRSYHCTVQGACASSRTTSLRRWRRETRYSVWPAGWMSKGKIEDTGGSGGSYSIKTQFNSEEQWTKALKFMLTNLKWGLAWVSSQFYNR